MLVHGDYVGLEKLSQERRLTSSEIEYGVKDYGCHLVSLPESAFEYLGIVEVEGTWPRTWAVDVPLWSLEEGRSDLTVELTLIEHDGEFYDVEIDGIHVL